MKKVEFPFKTRLSLTQTKQVTPYDTTRVTDYVISSGYLVTVHLFTCGRWDSPLALVEIQFLLRYLRVPPIPEYIPEFPMLFS